MTTVRLLALAAVGFGAVSPRIAPAQDAPSAPAPVTFATPRSTASRLALQARRTEAARLAAGIVGAFLHAPLPAEESRADYYDAWAYRIHDRTFPNETLPADAYVRAVERRLAMPPAPRNVVLGGRGTLFAPSATLGAAPGAAGAGPAGGGPMIASAGLWELVGPRKLPVPYTQYYGPANSITTGRIGGIAFDPADSNTIYMTGSAGGVFKTTNGGANWRPLGNGFVYPFSGPVAVSPADPNLVLVGTGDFDGGTGPGFGFLRSIDGGESWEWVAKDVIRNVAFSAIVFDRTTPGRVLASAGNAGSAPNGLWESLDDGLTWTERPLDGRTDLSLTSLSAGPTAANGDRPMVAASRTGGAYGVYESRDAGRNWTRIASYPATSGRTQVCASPTDPNVAYAVEGSLRKVYKGVRASDGAWTWTDITAGFPNGDPSLGANYNWSQYTYDEHITAVGHTVGGVLRDTLYVGLITIAAYDGATWTDIGRTYYADSKTHNDQHCFAVSSSDPTKMAFGNDGGIYRLTIAPDGTQTIDPRTSGDTSLAMFYTGAWHPTDPNRMIGGTQDNASPTAIGDLQNWANRTGGDGMGCAIDVQTPGRQYGSAQYNFIYRTTDAWNSSGFLRSIGGPFVGRMAVDRSPQGYLYVGGSSSLYRFDPAANAWTDNVGGNPFNAEVRSIAPAPGDPNTIYVGTTAGGLYVTTDRAATWRPVEVNAALGAISSVAVHPARPWDILVTTGQGPAHVYRYADTRLATPVRTPVSGAGGGALPDIFASSVVRNADRPDTDWYVATDVGVLGTTTGGASWFNMTEPLGLPPVEATTLEHTPGTGYLNLATYGRGMWRLKINEVPTPAALKMLGTLGRTNSTDVALRLAVANVGGEAARQVRVTLASITLAGTVYNPATAIPVTLGRIEPGATDVQTVTFRNPALAPGAAYRATIRVEWLSGTETKTQDLLVRGVLP